MSKEKSESVIEDIEILNKISKRLDKIEENENKLETKAKRHQEILNSQRRVQKDEVNDFQSECNEIETSLKQIRKTIFEIGRKLKRNVSNDELKHLQNEIDSKKFEEYLRRDELEKTYSRYAN